MYRKIGITILLIFLSFQINAQNLIEIKFENHIVSIIPELIAELSFPDPNNIHSQETQAYTDKLMDFLLAYQLNNVNNLDKLALQQLQDIFQKIPFDFTEDSVDFDRKNYRAMCNYFIVAFCSSKNSNYYFSLAKNHFNSIQGYSSQKNKLAAFEIIEGIYAYKNEAKHISRMIFQRIDTSSINSEMVRFVNAALTNIPESSK